jgi:hypothetical protein
MSSRLRSAFLALSTLAIVGATSAAAHADPPVRVGTSDTVMHDVELVRPNPTLMTTGVLTIISSYVPALIVAGSSAHRGDQLLYIPGAGPWLDLANRGCAPGQARRCGATMLETAGLATLGITHLLGVGQVIASIFVPQPRLVTLHQVGIGRVSVTPAMMGAGGYGLSASGSF